ncbi:hypothetical protein [Bombilactobacillus mellifer]|nr:hypothetical protein [Bombilactobacillus mellifer]
MAKYLSINRKKVKASKSVNGLVKEYFRDEKMLINLMMATV